MQKFKAICTQQRSDQPFDTAISKEDIETEQQYSMMCETSDGTMLTVAIAYVVDSTFSGGADGLSVELGTGRF